MRYRYLIYILVLSLCIYGAQRLYFDVTDGFSIGNISSEIPYDPQWEIPPLNPNEQKEIDLALGQPFTYLGKGCQSYVFLSQDGQYVIKFLKYKHFKPQWWLEWFTFIPPVRQYYNQKSIEKTRQLHKIFRSWKIGYENIPQYSGLVYIHLNKTPSWKQKIIIKDKMGFSHEIELGQFEFLLQHRASMLTETLLDLSKKQQNEKAEQIVDEMLILLLAEYTNGYADNDHALMQNTGVLHGRPIHIDVGQFIWNPVVMDPKVYHQEIYDKTYDFHVWLSKNYPEMALHLRTRLVSILGMEYYYKNPYRHKGNVGKIPDVSIKKSNDDLAK